MNIVVFFNLIHQNEMILQTEKDKIEFHFLFNLIVKEQTNELDREKKKKKRLDFMIPFNLLFLI